MRIAWFSPLPPHRSGIAAYSAELLPRLAAHDIEAFVDDGAGLDAPGRVPPVEGVTVRGAHDFPWRHARRPFDLVVYHVGNSEAHDYLWPYMVRYPGLVVLHDGQLHQARAQALIRQQREPDFRAEFAWCHPEVSPLLADLTLAGLGATLCYFWPMVHVPVQAARVAPPQCASQACSPRKSGAWASNCASPGASTTSVACSRGTAANAASV